MDISIILNFASALLAVGVAFVVVTRMRRSVPHAAFVAGMAVLAAESLLAGVSADAVLLEDMVYWQNWRLVALSFLPGIWLVFSLSYARGDHREALSKWRMTLACAFLLPPALALLFRGNLVTAIGRSETGLAWVLGLGTPALILNFLFLLSAVLVLMNLERTFRASVGTMRWRIKFMIIGLGVLFAVRAYSSSQVLLFRAVNLSIQTANSGALLVACLLILRSLARAGHFEVSVYPSQKVLYNSFTVLLAGLYLLIVGVLAKIVTFLGGDAAFTLKAFAVLVVLVLLTVLLLSDRVRLHTRRFVSRHFQRPLYDYRTVWRTFTEGTARCLEQKDLCATCVQLGADIFSSLSVTIWLVDDRKEQLVFGASTLLTEARAGQLRLEPAAAGEVLAGLKAQPGPLDLDACNEPWAASLRRLHPEEFRTGGNRIAVPLIAGGELLGAMVLGDRVGGVPFSLQDFDLLKSVSDQAAASLLNIQLSQRWSQAKQLEAFQSLSAFFVHDLKNTASTLSLMLQNLPRHFHDPQFREDALRGISKTVTHINDLIRRLSLLRQESALQPVESDLNGLVDQALEGLAGVVNVELIREFHPLPKVLLDPMQIQTVVTNLVLNARDAVPPGGRIRIETSLRDGWVMLAVTDNGCGMSPEFVQRSLFRPFQSTKKEGVGIGMFQCQRIVEGHKGRIEVESVPGQGTTFRVWLPGAPANS